jgi:hypothetical protein
LGKPPGLSPLRDGAVVRLAPGHVQRVVVEEVRDDGELAGRVAVLRQRPRASQVRRAPDARFDVWLVHDAVAREHDFDDVGHLPEAGPAPRLNREIAAEHRVSLADRLHELCEANVWRERRKGLVRRAGRRQEEVDGSSVAEVVDDWLGRNARPLLAEWPAAGRCGELRGCELDGRAADLEALARADERARRLRRDVKDEVLDSDERRGEQLAASMGAAIARRVAAAARELRVAAARDAAAEARVRWGGGVHTSRGGSRVNIFRDLS